MTAWATELPDARFKNQYGAEFINTGASGKNVVDLVFNEQLRAASSGRPGGCSSARSVWA